MTCDPLTARCCGKVWSQVTKQDRQTMGCVKMASEIVANIFFAASLIMILSGYWQVAILTFLGAVYFAIGVWLMTKELDKHGDSSG